MNKKILFLLFASFMGLIALSGCQQGKQEHAGEIDEVPMERRIGIIKSLGGVKTSNQGTHLLQLDNGDSILLKSLQINLDDSKYANMMVEVRGSLFYTTDGKQIMEVMNIDVLEEALSQQLATPNWKDYVSTERGFSIKYRDDLMVNTTSNVTFERKIEATQDGTQENLSAMEQTKKHSMVIRVTKREPDKTFFSEIGLKSDSSADLLAAGMTKSKIGAQSLDSIKKMENSKVSYFIESEEWLYAIYIDTGNDEKTLDDQNLFYEMLSTFRLLNKEDSNQDQADILNNLDIGEDGETTKKPDSATASGTTTTSANSEIDTAVSSQSSAATQETSSESQSDPGESTADSDPAASNSLTQETISGYSLLESEAFKFGIQYPKSWYYAGSVSNESGVVRHYDFGKKPIEEEPGEVAFDLMSGAMPGGTSVNTNGGTATKISKNGTVEIYVQGDGSRYYRLSGPATYESAMLQMAGTIQDK